MEIRAPYARPWVLTEIYFGSNTPRVERAVLGNVTEYRLNFPDTFDNSNSRAIMQNLVSLSNYAAQDVRNYNIYTASTVRSVMRQIIKTHFPTTANLVINDQEPAPVGDGR
jgi:hypothetical protein